MTFMRMLLGRQLASSEQDKEKIGVVAGVAAMGLDGLSSSAYGPEAALAILLPVGAASLHVIGPIMVVILVLLGMVYVSYRQTIAAYPLNGGSYTVARENLGVWASLFAAAALMIDYILTVAVGISAGVAALVSAEPSLQRWTIPLCLSILAVLPVMNLRGIAEAGTLLSVPTYFFLFTMAVVLGLGVVRSIGSGGHPHAIIAPPPLAPATEGLSLWLLLRSFASGCTAMTGVEAVSNGVSAFKESTVKNAHRTLTVIVVALAILLGAIAWLVRGYSIGAMDQTQAGYQSVISQLTAAVVGRGWFYLFTSASVLSVLCLSANTSFVDFPRLCRLVALNGFLPQSFEQVGRRLVYTVGILFLASMAALLLIGFRGITDRLIPLYAVGAFLAFTLSQTGMVVHWLKQNERGSKAIARMSINGIGAICTGAALIIILAAKFIEGAWVTIVAIPVLILLFKLTHRHYEKLSDQLRVRHLLDLQHNSPPIAIVPSRGWDRPMAKALRFAMWISKDVWAVHLGHLAGDAADAEMDQLRQCWSREVETPADEAGLPRPKLIFINSPYRQFLEPLLAEISRLQNENKDREIAVVVPELVANHWWLHLLHSRKAAILRSALLQRGDHRVIVIEVPWYLEG